MEMFGGGLDEALASPIVQWKRYPYARSANKESFSQSLFRLLGLPEAATESTGKITLHQILRLLYAEQMSPIDDLFRFEQFDSPDVRDAVGRLLCGAYDDTLYADGIRIRSLEKAQAEVDGELRSLYSIIGHSGNVLTSEWLRQEQLEIEAKQSSLASEIAEAERDLAENVESEKFSITVQKEAYAALQKEQRAYLDLQEEFDSVSLDIADSEAFIEHLRAKLEDLSDMKLVSEHFHSVEFQVCPACYVKIEPDPAVDQSSSCHLCKTPFSSARAQHRISALVNDTAIQLKQSEMLQEGRHASAKLLLERIVDQKARWKDASEKYRSIKDKPSTRKQNNLRELQRKAGYLDRLRDDLREKEKMVSLVSSLTERKSRIIGELEQLRDRVNQLRKSQESRLSKAYSSIADITKKILLNDLPREDIFQHADQVQFDFRKNSISVDGESYFSASSRVILKSAFTISFLLAAADNASFRHPRICVVDTIEDKGMELERSQNFQLLTAKLSAAAKSEHQIIFATSMIADALDKPEFTVGKRSTHESKTLDLI